MARLRLGVIGAGAWSVTSHLPNLAQRGDEVEFVAVCRRGEAELQRVAERFGFPIATEDYREVLAADVDLCVVASPTGLHHEHAKAAMEAGAHVLVEKPFTITAADAWDLVDTAARTDRHLVISYGWNYLPLVGGMKALIDEHGIGTIEHVVVHMGSTTRELLSNTGSYPQADPDAVPEQATWTDPELSGGGYAQAQLTHALGISLWLTGLRGAEAFALMSYPLDAPVELHDAISVRYDNGAIGTVSGGSAHVGANGNKNQLVVRAIGSDGQFHLDVERERAWLWRRDGLEEALDVTSGDGDYNCDGPPHALVDLVLGKRTDNPSPGELGARTVELLDAAYRSGRSGQLERVERLR